MAGRLCGERRKRARSRAAAFVVAMVAMAAAASSLHGATAHAAEQHLINRDFPDPTIVRSGVYWYAFATNGSNGNVQVMRSTDLASWTALPDALPELPAWAARNFTWAPGVLARPNGFVLFFTARHRTTGLQCIGRATSLAIAGPYRDSSPQPFVCQMDRRGSIDPAPFVARDGSPYLLYKSEGIAGAEPTRIWSQPLSSDGTALAGEPVQLAVTDQGWEEPIIEGPTMAVIGGEHWLFYAGNHWESPNYAIGVARCAGPLGPCRKRAGPLFASTSTVAGPGSPDVVTLLDGRSMLTFHAWEPSRTSYATGGKRTVRAIPLRVDAGRLLVGDGAPAGAGYRMVASDGGIFTFGDATFEGSAGHLALRNPIAAMASTPTGRGYWLASRDGGVFAFGDAPFLGAQGDRRLTSPIVGIAATPTGRGYWLVAADGGIFAHGDARFFGSTGGMRLNRPIVAMAPTASGAGYWLVASDGGIFAFGDAPFHGSTGALRLNSPIVAMLSTPWDDGYWLVAGDGGVFAFGRAQFYGSTGALRINSPIVAAAVTPTGRGYWFTGGDGGVYAFGDAPFHGSTGDRRLNAPVVGLAP